MNVTFVQLIPGVQMFSIGSAQLFFFSFIVLSRNNYFTYAVLVNSNVNKSCSTFGKSLNTILTVEYQFWIVAWKIVWRNCSSEIAVSRMFSKFGKSWGTWEERGICVSRMESFVWSSRSVALRLMISCLRSRTWAFSSLSSIWISFVVSCWKGFGTGYFWKSFVRLGASISNLMTFFCSSRIKSLWLLKYSLFFSLHQKSFPLDQSGILSDFYWWWRWLLWWEKNQNLIYLPQTFDSNQLLCHY